MLKRTTTALLALALTGCASTTETAQLRVHRAASDETYVTSFDRALFSENAGQTDIVLLSGTGQSSVPGEGPVSNGPAVRQTVHLKVLWSPTRTIRLDSPSAGNAMINWVVSAGNDDKVVYGGSCWARVSVDGDVATVDLREANVSVRQVTGNMVDPLKHAKLEGKFTANRGDAIVQAYVSDIRQASNNATASLPSRQAVPQ